jgi:hypothetical protein
MPVIPLKDITREWDRKHAVSTAERAQIIYATAEGLDYCRETAPGLIRTYHAASDWARTHFDRIADGHARRLVTQFRVEWF